MMIVHVYSIGGTIMTKNNELTQAQAWLMANGFGCSKAQMAAMAKTQKQTTTGVADYKATARHAKGSIIVRPKG